MYYCTIYMQPSGRLSDKSSFDLFLCLSYIVKADAESCKQKIIQQAIDQGGRVYLDEEDYTTITGKIIFKSTGMTSNRSTKHYKVGVEKTSTRFSLLPDKTGVSKLRIKDGLTFEKRVAEIAQHKKEDELAKQNEATSNLARFAAEISSMTELYPVLRSFVRYSNQRTDKEKLAELAIKKIQELSKKK